MMDAWTFRKSLGVFAMAVAKMNVKKNLAKYIKTTITHLKWPLFLVSVISSLGVLNVAHAVNSNLPAVANINGWIGAAANYFHRKDRSGAGGVAEAGIDFPLTHDFAIQFHGYDGAFGRRNIQSADGLLFMRNPSVGLLGPHVIYAKSGLFHHTLVGLHGEYYLSNLTLTGEGGGLSGSNDNSAWYGEAILSWYVLPDLRFYLGGIVLDNDGAGELGTEYQLGFSSLPGLSLFANVGAGSHDLWYGFLGLRYYFGDCCNPCKTLVQRHREDMVPPTMDLYVTNRHHNV